MKKLSELFKPRSQGERHFFDMHKAKETADPYGNGSDVRNGSNIKRFDRIKHRYGHNPGEDETEYAAWDGEGETPSHQVRVPALAVGNWNKEETELREVETARNRTHGFHGTIAGTHEEKTKLFHAFHNRVKTLTGADDAKMVRDFLDSAHGRKVAEMINTNQEKDAIHHHVLARWKAFKGMYSPDHFKEEFLPEWPDSVNATAGMPSPYPHKAEHPTKPDREGHKKMEKERLRSHMSYHAAKASEHGSSADEHERHAEVHRKQGKHTPADLHTDISRKLRRVAHGHDKLSAHYGRLLGIHH